MTELSNNCCRLSCYSKNKTLNIFYIFSFSFCTSIYILSLVMLRRLFFNVTAKVPIFISNNPYRNSVYNSYGVKHSAKERAISPFSYSIPNATHSLWCASLFLLPSLPFSPFLLKTPLKTLSRFLPYIIRRKALISYGSSQITGTCQDLTLKSSMTH